MNKLHITSIIVGSVLLAGCSTSTMPLVFGQARSIGLDVSGSVAPQQSIGISLGYKDDYIAVVPKNERAEAPDDNGHVHRDALSVLGQFDLKTKIFVGEQTGTTASAGLGNFFATGLAAKTLADGFACKLSLTCGSHNE